MFYCSDCLKSFASRQSYQLHNMTKHFGANYSQPNLDPNNIGLINTKKGFGLMSSYDTPNYIKKPIIPKESTIVHPIKNANLPKPQNFQNEYDEFDPSLKAPFSMVISGMSQSGKSSLVGKLLKRRHDIIDTMGKGPIHKILYCYSEPQYEFFKNLKRWIPSIIFHKGLPQQYSDGSDTSSIIVLDDLMNEASKSDDAIAAFTRTSHHRNVCLIILVQNFFHKSLRSITSTCHYIIIMKNPRDSAALNYLGRQMNRGKKNEVLEEAYKDCMKKPYGYVFIDCSQHQNDKYRISYSIFSEDCIIYAEP